MRIVLLVFALLTSLLAQPAMAQKKAVKPAVKRGYVRRDLGFAFNPPRGWREGARASSPNLLMELHREGEDIHGGNTFFYGTIEVTLQNAPSSVMPANLGESMDAYLKKTVPEYALSNTASFKVAGQPAVAIAFQARDTQNGITAYFRQVFVLRKKQLWGFGLKGKIEEFDRYVEDFDKMMASIVWLPAK